MSQECIPHHNKHRVLNKRSQHFTVRLATILRVLWIIFPKNFTFDVVSATVSTGGTRYNIHRHRKGLLLC
jgi:hypothetical protein